MNSVIAILIGLLAISAFFLFFRYAYILAFGKNFIRKNFSKKIWIIFGILVFAGFMLCVFSLSKNSYVYYWDYGGYWTGSYNYMNTLYETPGQAIYNLGSSIQNSDYNLILPLIISLPLKIFGITFSRYVLINYFIFLVPTFFIAFSLFIKVSQKFKTSSTKKSIFAAFLTISTFTIPFRAMLVGYIDVALLIPIFLLFALAIDYDSCHKPKDNLKKNIIIGCLLVTTFLFRRYAAFFLVGFIAALVITEIIKIITKRKSRNIKILIKNFFFNFLTIAVTSLGIMFAFFSPLVLRILKENYSDMYVGYNLSLPEKSLQIINRFGLIFLSLSIFGVIYSFIKNKYRRLVSISILTFFITIALFFRVQRMDIHHIYTITAPVAILSFLGIYYIVQIGKKLLTIAVSCILLINPIYFFFSTAQNFLSPVSILFNVKYSPLYRNDMASLRELVNYLNTETTGNIYVLASGGNLNSDILKSINKPNQENAISRLLVTHDVDLRDGFPTEFLTAETIVTTNPINLHLAEGSQEVVRYLAEQIQDSTSYIGDNFKKISTEFSVNNNYPAQVYIYHRISDFTEEDIKKIADYYSSLYPEHPELFEDRIIVK